MVNIKKVTEGNVVLIAGGGKIYTDIASRFVKSERPITEIIDSPYSKKIVDTIISSGHTAALEFDYFLFGVEGYSRVCETQLVRKRLASYLIKSGRAELNGKRSYNVVIPKNIENCRVILPYLTPDGDSVNLDLNTNELLNILEEWYDQNLEKGIPEEDLRYLKPQATEFKAIIGMNAHALIDWFKIRCCKNAQAEIRDLANKMLHLCKSVAPDIFKNAGASCVDLGYCPENDYQHKTCIKKVIRKDKALEILYK